MVGSLFPHFSQSVVGPGNNYEIKRGEVQNNPLIGTVDITALPHLPSLLNPLMNYNCKDTSLVETW